MPSSTVHDAKKHHNYNVCQYLGRVPDTHADWEVVTLFYSALHYVDSFLASDQNIEFVRNHYRRKQYIRSHMPIIERNYRLLYHLSTDARYEDLTIGNRELTKAKSYYGHIKFRLTPIVCSNCGHHNLINEDNCKNCGSAL